MVPCYLWGQDVRSGEARVISDTLCLNLDFPAGSSSVNAYDGDNGLRMDYFRETLSYLLSTEGAFVSDVLVRTYCSVQGSTQDNIRLSSERAENLREFICNEFGVSPFNVHVTSEGEDWKELEDVIMSLSNEEFPWKQEILSIIRSEEEFSFRDGGYVSSRRKDKLMSIDGGMMWDYLVKMVFPSLSGGHSEATFYISSPISVFNSELGNETHSNGRMQKDTVVVTEYVPIEFDSRVDKRFASRVSGKRFLFSIKTNILGVPLANVGVEFPFSKSFSVGVNYYYPWIKRDALHQTCNELVAYDLDVRYWLPNDRKPVEARLLGHSFGIYGAGGHYDFERNWEGHQGTFFNIGFDWKYAWPVFHGRMHMEFELGLGMIYSDAQPYEVYDEYGKAFRIPGQRDIIRWYGPTRAQLTICVPLYRNVYNYRRAGK